MMKFTESRTRENAEKYPYGEKVGGQTCRHGLEHKKCKVCSEEYHKDEKGEETEGRESKKTADKEVHERVRSLREDKKELPVFMRTRKGLKFSHMKKD